MLKSILKSLIFICLIGVVCGFEIPNYEWYVTDKVWVFSETQKADLTSKIEEIEKATSIEIAILVVPTVDDDINLAAADVGNKWWVGKKGQDNGLMVLIAVNDRKRSIQVGYGLEGTLPDLAVKNIGDARFPPNFRNGDYYQGIIEMLDDVLWYIKQDPTIVQTYSQATTSSSSSDDKNMVFLFIVFIALTSLFGRWVTVPSKGNKRKMKKHGRWIYGGTGLVLSFIITWIIANLIIAAMFSYIFLLFGVLAALSGRTRPGVFWFGSWGSGWLWWGSSFGWFGWWGFGGGGWWGSR